VFAAAAGLVLAPLFLTVAVVVWTIDGRPVLIRLPRVGRAGSRFGMWKVRTMPVGAGGPAITASSDRRVTRLGRSLRRFRIDEIPQLMHVMRGTMALIGPRPETPDLVDLSAPMWRGVLAARPGIAGVAQLLVGPLEASSLAGASVERRYREHFLPKKLVLDRWYVERATPMVDAWVCVSLVQQLILRRPETSLHRLMRRELPAVMRELDDLEHGEIRGEIRIDRS
jgi:lipopolysaccharide/colanic/teichoic acid biosynthesis glycosyltransferase